MSKIGGFTKTRNYARRRHAVGRYTTPYQYGGSASLPIIPFLSTDQPSQLPRSYLQAQRRFLQRAARRNASRTPSQTGGLVVPMRFQPWIQKPWMDSLPYARIKAAHTPKTRVKR